MMKENNLKTEKQQHTLEKILQRLTPSQRKIILESWERILQRSTPSQRDLILEHMEAAAILKARRFENLAGEHLITIQQLNAENERLQRRIEELKNQVEDTRNVKKRRVKKSKVSKPTFK